MSYQAQRDVQEALMANKGKRKTDRVVYPLTQYTSDLADLDIWDNMFFENIWGSPTVYNFETPPHCVLDVGCGTGWWVLSMAQRWPETTFVGFDITDIQPSLEDQHISNLADRVSWVNGNFLRDFPFPNDTFDYVRVCRAGLAIPEDEWQWFLENCWRIMKIKGVIEIIDEDLIFPMPSGPALAAETQDSPPVSRTQTLTLEPDFNSSASWSASSLSSSSGYLSPTSPTSTTASSSSSALVDKEGRKPRARLTSLMAAVNSNGKESTPTSSDHSSSPTPERVSPSLRNLTTPTFDYRTHPQNHSKLRSAWDAMLARRFVSNRLMSVLPFYISTVFQTTEVFPLYTVPLPTNTQLSYSPWDDSDSLFSVPRRWKNKAPGDQDFPAVPVDVDNLVNHPIATELPRLQAMDLLEWTGMHLRYTVTVIASCKGAIREEYYKLFPRPDYSSPRLERTTTGVYSDYFFSMEKTEPFEVEWNDWICDMEDRMRIRQRLPDFIPSWSEPTDPRGGKPQWRRWRKAIDQRLSMHNISVFEFPANPNDLCRHVKAFMAWKGEKPGPVI